MDYVGTVWYRRSMQRYNGVWRDVYTKQVVRLTATGVDDFKQHALADAQDGLQVEFGPIGQSWAQQRRRVPAGGY